MQKMRDEHSDHTLHVLVYDGGMSQANAFVGDVLRQNVLTVRSMPMVFLVRL